MRCAWLCLLILPALSPADEIDKLLADIRGVGAEGAGAAKARAAWASLVQKDGAVLPRILEAIEPDDVVVANWLRGAFDRIAERELVRGTADAEALSRFALDPSRPGRARRLAVEVVERIRPGTLAKWLAGWTNDPEFREDAIDQALAKLDAEAAGEQKLTTLRQLFAAARDYEQSRAVASRLRQLGERVSVADHFGFLRDWYVIGPFDGHSMTSFTREYPPEKKVDLSEELVGKEGQKLRWQRFTVEEATAGKHVALVNLRKPLGDALDAVAYAYTAIRVDTPREVELRGAGDDHITVWVNGRRVFGFEEYRNGVRFDRHRFSVRLRRGENSILVKIAQAELDRTNPAPNWEFLLRVCDADGKGLPFPSALPPAVKE